VITKKSVGKRRKKHETPTLRNEPEAGIVRPFLKWAGSKSQLLPVYRGFFPSAERVKRYIEPFVGCGAVFFDVQRLLAPRHSILCDNNAELITAFEVVRDRVDDLIVALKDYAQGHSQSRYYDIRKQQPSDPVAIAARLIYLNKTCFNGLYRVNSKGFFNVPYGRHKNPTILMEDRLREVSRVLQGVETRNQDFREIPGYAETGDFIYFDPPYYPLSGTSYFTSYTKGLFLEQDQRDLAEIFSRLDHKKCLLMLSNSDTPLIRELYKKFTIHEVQARRNINSKGDKRGFITELLICNFSPSQGGLPTVQKPTPGRTKPALHRGDGGETQLASGERVPKDDPHIECCGTVDELSSYVGLARAALVTYGKDPQGLDTFLRRVQHDLYRLGTQLGTRAGERPIREGHDISQEDVSFLDQELLRQDALLPRLRSFILPGGGLIASHLHVARAICRRAERQVVRLNLVEPSSSAHLIPYLNRLSLVLFASARLAAQIASVPEETVSG
jgi:DNA adenine methylase